SPIQRTHRELRTADQCEPLFRPSQLKNENTDGPTARGTKERMPSGRRPDLKRREQMSLASDRQAARHQPPAGPGGPLASRGSHPLRTAPPSANGSRHAVLLLGRCGVGHVLLSSYECGRSEPAWQSVAKLIRVLGVEWLVAE